MVPFLSYSFKKRLFLQGRLFEEHGFISNIIFNYFCFKIDNIALIWIQIGPKFWIRIQIQFIGFHARIHTPLKGLSKHLSNNG